MSPSDAGVSSKRADASRTQLNRGEWERQSMLKILVVAASAAALLVVSPIVARAETIDFLGSGRNAAVSITVGSAFSGTVAAGELNWRWVGTTDDFFTYCVERDDVPAGSASRRDPFHQRPHQRCPKRWRPSRVAVQLVRKYDSDVRNRYAGRRAAAGALGGYIRRRFEPRSRDRDVPCEHHDGHLRSGQHLLDGPRGCELSGRVRYVARHATRAGSGHECGARAGHLDTHGTCWFVACEAPHGTSSAQVKSAFRRPSATDPTEDRYSRDISLPNSGLFYLSHSNCSGSGDFLPARGAGAGKVLAQCSSGDRPPLIEQITYEIQIPAGGVCGVRGDSAGGL